MRRVRRSFACGLTARITALGLFLFGTNFCAVAAMAGTPGAPAPIACHQMISAEDAGSTAYCPEHDASKDTAKDTSASHMKPGAPCCVSLSPVTSPKVEKAQPFGFMLVKFLFAEPPRPVVMLPTWHGLSTESPPPSLAALAHDPDLSRAPPRS